MTGSELEMTGSELEMIGSELEMTDSVLYDEIGSPAIPWGFPSPV
jgi:hypothetical protein